MPIPSMSANNTPPTKAEDAIARGPARAAKAPPVAAPEMIEFHGSSYKIFRLEQKFKKKRETMSA